MLPVHLALPTAAAALLTALLVPPTSMASAGDPSCNGKQATIVVADGGQTHGTPGNDVVVAHGATSVWTAGGDDVVCIFSGHNDYSTVDTGDGDDEVVVSSPEHSSTTVDLGAGSDSLTGGAGPDHVMADGYKPVSSERDEVRTGAGDDDVRTGIDGRPNDDYFDLGAGNDNLRFQGTSDADGSFEGGEGIDTLIGNTDAPFSIDVPARSMATEPGVRTSLSGFDGFHLFRSPDVTFRGGPGDEDLETLEGLDAVMGGGDDTMTVPIDQVVRVSGGPGHDKVELQQFNNGRRPPRVSMVVDLRRERLQLRGVVREGAHLDAEDVGVYGAFAVQVVGDADPNEIEIHESCVRRVLAGGGDDVVDVEVLWCRRGAELLGGAGHDRIWGTEQADVLLGGPGRDRINGRAGMDRCDGEVEKRCER